MRTVKKIIKLYFPKFRFSWAKTLTSICLACLMLWASSWQWQRYNYKIELKKKLLLNSQTEAEQAGADFFLNKEPKDLKFKKVTLNGECDFEKEMILLNRRHASGPGYLLICPFKIENSEHRVLVSRGFIPFIDRNHKNWAKYQDSMKGKLTALVKVSKSAGFLRPKNPEASLEMPFERQWLFMDVGAISKQLPYPVIEGVYLEKYHPGGDSILKQKKGAKKGPPVFSFPVQHIKLEVPPEVHFGYTFEWILLAGATLIITFLLQAFPRKVKPT